MYLAWRKYTLGGIYPGTLGGRYTLVYIPYYTHPGYTPVYHCQLRTPSTSALAMTLPGEEALGSNPEITVGMRRIQASFSLRCEERCASAHRVTPLLRDKVMKDRIDEGTISHISPM